MARDTIIDKNDASCSYPHLDINPNNNDVLISGMYFK